jgi:hypothetical protein
VGPEDEPAGFLGGAGPFRRFLGGQTPEKFEQRGQGTGVIVNDDGYVWTNNHVVADANEVTVKLIDDRTRTAEVVGTDDKTDLAVLKIDASGLVPAPIGDSDEIEVGEWVVAIGNPFGLEQTVTSGIVEREVNLRLTSGQQVEVDLGMTVKNLTPLHRPFKPDCEKKWGKVTTEGPPSPDQNEDADSEFVRVRKKNWAKLIAKTWLENPELSPKRGKEMKVVAAISSLPQDDVIEEYCETSAPGIHLGGDCQRHAPFLQAHTLIKRSPSPSSHSSRRRTSIRMHRETTGFPGSLRLFYRRHLSG